VNNLTSKSVRAGLVGLFLLPFVLHGQAVVENANMRVEIIGLKRWTIPMIQDSLAKYAPHDSLLTHSCAAILRYKLKFADASVDVFPKGEIGLKKDFVVVTVIEPEDSALVRYRPEFPDTLPLRKDWQEAWQVVERHNEAFQAAIQSPTFTRMDVPSLLADARLKAAFPLQAFLKSHSRRQDFQLALKTLKTDGNWKNRVVAIAMLRSFPQNDATWWALVEALRDPNGRVGSAAGQTLHGMSYGDFRPVDWRPATKTLRMLLDGTSLFTYNSVLNALAKTKIDTRMANTLLGGGGNLVLAKLASSSLADRSAAYGFLVQISGKGWTESSTDWKNWVEGLKARPVM
jgi:hypothetical protein